MPDTGGRIKISELPNLANLPDAQLSNYYLIIEGLDVENPENDTPKSYKITAQRFKASADISLYLTKLDPSGSGTFTFQGDQTLSGNLAVGGRISQATQPVNQADVVTKGIVEGYIGEPYSNQSTYLRGQYAIYLNKLYVCNTDISVPENFNSSKWDQIKLTNVTGGGASSAMIASDYNPAATYQGDEYTVYQGVLYRCISLSGATGPFDPYDWTETTAMHEVESAFQIIDSQSNSIVTLTNNFAPPYSTLATYQIGDAIIRNQQLYKCNTANTTGAWDSNKWDATTVAELFVNGTNISY